MLDEIPKVSVGEVIIKDHSKLLCFTDGLVELEVGDKMEIGMKLISNLFSNNKNLRDTFLDLTRHIDLGKKNKAVVDDISLFGIEFKV